MPDREDRKHLLRLAFFMAIVDGRRSPEEKALQARLFQMLDVRPEEVEGVSSLSERFDALGVRGAVDKG